MTWNIGFRSKGGLTSIFRPLLMFKLPNWFIDGALSDVRVKQLIYCYWMNICRCQTNLLTRLALTHIFRCLIYALHVMVLIQTISVAWGYITPRFNNSIRKQTLLDVSDHRRFKCLRWTIKIKIKTRPNQVLHQFTDNFRCPGKLS